MDMIAAQHVDEIFTQVTDTARALHAREVSILDPGDGSTVARYADAYPATVQALLRRVSDTFGVDVAGVLSGKTNGASAGRATEGSRAQGGA